MTNVEILDYIEEGITQFTEAHEKAVGEHDREISEWCAGALFALNKVKTKIKRN